MSELQRKSNRNSIVKPLGKLGVVFSKDVQLVWLPSDEMYALKVPKSTSLKLLGLPDQEAVRAFEDTIREMVGLKPR